VDQQGPQLITRVLFLDLDGTVRHGRGELGKFVNSPDDVVVFPEAVDRMREWTRGGGRIVGVSNQGGIALGYLSEGDCRAAMQRTQELADGLFDLIVWCSHHPAAPDPRMASCFGRKPAPGLLFEGAWELAGVHPDEFYPPNVALMVGDRPEDEECARRAGVKFMSADQWRAGAHEGN
jgi:D-glycero-D-manno-heptose 1,7-bisphosphate phosphatase